MDINEKIELAIKSINDFLNGNISSESIENLWNAEMNDEIFNEAFHTLMHYISDIDIRRKDPKYSVYQSEELNECVNKLLKSKTTKNGNSRQLQ